MPFFQKKPVVIEARQLTADNLDEIIEWINQIAWIPTAYPTGDSHQPLLINTLEGAHTATLGDWIIKGVKCEFYPCKPDIFLMTYEMAKENAVEQEDSND